MEEEEGILGFGIFSILLFFPKVWIYLPLIFDVGDLWMGFCGHPLFVDVDVIAFTLVGFPSNN